MSETKKPERYIHQTSTRFEFWHTGGKTTLSFASLSNAYILSRERKKAKPQIHSTTVVEDTESLWYLWLSDLSAED